VAYVVVVNQKLAERDAGRPQKKKKAGKKDHPCHDKKRGGGGAPGRKTKVHGNRCLGTFGWSTLSAAGSRLVVLEALMQATPRPEILSSPVFASPCCALLATKCPQPWIDNSLPFLSVSILR
ncbi:unnamed protein product, partial [Prorocentrum cordatum]